MILAYKYQIYSRNVSSILYSNFEGKYIRLAHTKKEYYAGMSFFSTVVKHQEITDYDALPVRKNAEPHSEWSLYTLLFIYLVQLYDTTKHPKEV